MAFASDNRTHTLTIGDRFTDFVARVQEYRRKQKIYRDTMNELNQLTSAELADIGLNRSMLQSVARDAAENA